MGREATCKHQVGKQAAVGKVLLEARELIIRGELRRTIPIAAMTQVKVSGERLGFEAAGERVWLELGAAAAAKWREAIGKPPPSLAQKLGIKPGMDVQVIGTIASPELKSALRGAGKVSPSPGELIVVEARTAAALAAVLQKAGPQLRQGTPIWIAYPKGAGSEIGETAVRAALLAAGLKDSKVAAVSATTTALRFAMPRVRSVQDGGSGRR